MAQAGLDAIGLISGTLGIIQFFQSLFPKANVDAGTVVRIKAGLGDSSSSELGGKITAVYGFDINNDYLGNSPSGSLGAGDTVDLTISQSDPGRRGDFISIANSNDAVCIEWITVTQYDGSNGGAWTGDIGYWCGQSWYYGKQVAGTLPNGGGDYSPYCTWLDGDGTNGIPSASLKFTSDAYGATASDTLSNNQDCSATIFTKDTGPIGDKPAGTPSSKRDLAKRTRPASTENKLIISKKDGHTAEHLCNHPNSLGPDFIGSDNQFCDMGSKTLSPLCSVKEVDGCVNVSNGTIARRTSVARRSVDIVTKSYKTVTLWE